MWTMFTNIGDAAVTLPVAALCTGWIALSDTRLAWRWVLALAAGIAVVGATKILYAGWGVSLPAYDFRVVSGHAMLSTSVWIVAITLQLTWWRQPPLPGICAGMGIGFLTGMARVADHSHSLSEVLAGWILGTLVAMFFLRGALKVGVGCSRPMWSALSLLLVSTLAYGHKAPLQYLIDTRAPEIHRRASSSLAFLSQNRYRVQPHDVSPAR